MAAPIPKASTVPLPISSLTTNMEADTNETPGTAYAEECSSPISSTSTQRGPSLYFAYGSNLSTTQMDQRCPTSRLYETPLAVLQDYQWFIASRGYASVRPAIGKRVYGLLFELDEEAEDSLDMYEGVGFEKQGCYYKEEIWVNLLCAFSDGEDSVEDMRSEESSDEERSKVKMIETGMKVKALVYIDCTDDEGELGDAYASRLKRGVEESGELGLSIGASFGKWMDQVMKAEAREGKRKLRRGKVQRESSGAVVEVGNSYQIEHEIPEQEKRGMRDYYCC